MDGENNGLNPKSSMDDLGGKHTIFGNIHVQVEKKGRFDGFY